MFRSGSVRELETNTDRSTPTQSLLDPLENNDFDEYS